jgi:Permuted papain-like amidase enzyme, YaeF/YiiX, C92 family
MKKCIGIISMFFIGILLFGGFLPGIAQSQVSTAKETAHALKDLLLNDNESKKQYFVPSYLEIGDLVFFDSSARPGRWNVRGYDHVAIYIGDQKFVGSTRNVIQHTLEVNISEFSFFLNVLHYKNPMFARVTSATPAQRQNATKWALSRIGDLYQTWDPRKVADPNSSIITADQWYCSEIVWAAYYNIGIDIDRNGWTRDFPWFFPLFSAVSCDDIFYDDDVTPFS